jgi:hypothetical protein
VLAPGPLLKVFAGRLKNNSATFKTTDIERKSTPSAQSKWTILPLALGKSKPAQNGEPGVLAQSGEKLSL